MASAEALLATGLEVCSVLIRTAAALARRRRKVPDARACNSAYCPVAMCFALVSGRARRLSAMPVNSVAGGSGSPSTGGGFGLCD